MFSTVKELIMLHATILFKHELKRNMLVFLLQSFGPWEWRAAEPPYTLVITLILATFQKTEP
jgi:hypothetical protein